MVKNKYDKRVSASPSAGKCCEKSLVLYTYYTTNEYYNLLKTPTRLTIDVNNNYM